MHVLLDECIPRKLKAELADHSVTTVVEAGWSGKKNGELLKLAENRFDAFVTIDQNLSYQQKLSNFKIAVILLIAEDSDLASLKPFMPKVVRKLKDIQKGYIYKIGS